MVEVEEDWGSVQDLSKRAAVVERCISVFGDKVSDAVMMEVVFVVSAEELA